MPERDTFDDLDDLQPEWVEADDDLGLPVPDGIYQVEVTRVELTRTQQTRQPMVSWEFEIIGPTHQGRKMFDNQVIRGETHEDRLKSLSYVKSRLNMLGYVPDNLRDLADDNVRAELLGRCVEVLGEVTQGGVRGRETDRVEGPGLRLGGEHDRDEQAEQHHGPDGHPPPHAVRQALGNRSHHRHRTRPGRR